MRQLSATSSRARPVRAAGSFDALLDVEGGAQQDRVVGGSQLAAARIAELLGDACGGELRPSHHAVLLDVEALGARRVPGPVGIDPARQARQAPPSLLEVQEDEWPDPWDRARVAPQPPPVLDEVVALGVGGEGVEAQLGEQREDAVLHHIPDLAGAFSEFARVLRPGGAVVFCGEPSRNGDRLAAVPKRAGTIFAPVWRRLVGADAAGPNGDHAHHAEHALESEVDVHAFAPDELEAMLGEVGFGQVRVRGEELLANVYGWWLRSLESSAVPEQVPVRWRRFAFRSYLALQRVDVAALEPRLPPSLFYNLVLSARRAS